MKQTSINAIPKALEIPLDASAKVAILLPLRIDIRLPDDCVTRISPAGV